MASNDFIIENGKVVAYVGDSDASEITIPDGVTEIGERIFQEKIKDGFVINIASSVKVIEDYAFFISDSERKCLCSQVNIPDGSVLESVGEHAFCGSTKTLFVPETCKKIDSDKYFDDALFKVENFIFKNGTISYNVSQKNENRDEKIKKIPRGIMFCEDFNDFILVVPKEVIDIKNLSATYVFFEGSIPEKWHLEIDKESYVFENVDYDSVQYVDKTETTGVAYISTSKGAIITDIINSKANFSEIPTMVDGKKVLSINIYHPTKHNENMSHEEIIEFFEKEEKARLGALYPKIKYYQKDRQKKLDKCISKNTPKIDRDNYDDYSCGIFDNKKDKPTIKFKSPLKRMFLYAIIGLVLGAVLGAEVLPVFLYVTSIDQLIVKSIICAGIGLVALPLIYLLIYIIKNKGNFKGFTKPLYNGSVKGMYSASEENVIEECLLHKALILINDDVKNSVSIQAKLMEQERSRNYSSSSSYSDYSSSSSSSSSSETNIYSNGEYMGSIQQDPIWSDTQIIRDSEGHEVGRIEQDLIWSNSKIIRDSEGHEIGRIDKK